MSLNLPNRALNREDAEPFIMHYIKLWTAPHRIGDNTSDTV